MDCCHACFSVSLIEGERILRQMQELVLHDPDLFSEIVGRAHASKGEWEKELAMASGNPQALSDQIARVRIRCPLLADDGRCVLYQARPVTCVVYGLPTELGGTGHVCGFSGFHAGQRYPTVKLDRINMFLVEMSRELGVLRQIPAARSTEKRSIHEIVLALAK